MAGFGIYSTGIYRRMRESIRERTVLMRIAPHLSTPSALSDAHLWTLHAWQGDYVTGSGYE